MGASGNLGSISEGDEMEEEKTEYEEILDEFGVEFPDVLEGTRDDILQDTLAQSGDRQSRKWYLKGRLDDMKREAEADETALSSSSEEGKQESEEEEKEKEGSRPSSRASSAQVTGGD